MDLLPAHEGVRDLVGRYADAINRWDLGALADCFATDGIWDVIGIAKGEGREGVLRVMTKSRNAFDWIFQLVHSVTVLEPEEFRACARVYCSEVAQLNGKPLYLCWMYSDVCVVEGGRWRFARRSVDCLYSGPPSLTAPVGVYPAPTR